MRPACCSPDPTAPRVGAALADGFSAVPPPRGTAAFGTAGLNGLLQPLTAAPSMSQQACGRALADLATRPDEAVSLSFSLPFCAAHCLCCDRDIRAGQPEAAIDDYVDGLIGESRTLAGRLGAPRELLQLHLGGGSANELENHQLSRLVDALRELWSLHADTEMSIDCDPRRSSWTQLQLLHSLGFTRVSFGVLDLDTRVQQAIGRCQSVALIDDVCDLARSCGLECINLELMIGLPHQSLTSWRNTLRRVVAMAPERITLAGYRHRPHLAPGQHAIDADALPEEADRRAMLALSADMLRTAGYCWIGADQFVLETDALVHAQAQGRLRRSQISYTGTSPSALLGHGVAAVSEIDGQVFWNSASMPVWRQAVRDGHPPASAAQPMTAGRERLRQAQQQLLCNLELPQATLGDGLQPAYERVARHAQSGWVQRLDDRIVVTDTGRLALPMLCAELDAWSSLDTASLPRT